MFSGNGTEKRSEDSRGALCALVCEALYCRYGDAVGVEDGVAVLVRVNVLLGVNVRVRVLVRVGDLVLVSVGAVTVFALIFTKVYVDSAFV